jgi:hypothetical protein
MVMGLPLGNVIQSAHKPENRTIQWLKFSRMCINAAGLNESGTIFLLITTKQFKMEQQSQEARIVDISQSGKSLFKSVPTPSASTKRLQIRESVSWSICFAIVAAITGALLIYKIGVTMSVVTFIMFYFSLAGVAFFIAKLIRLYRSKDVIVRSESALLN